ncbi:hypothetical protein AVW12_21515 [Priestia aryabhattai]|nr:hypothetical protein AVW12_21515 [Priestia aryabhattai]
MISVVRFFVMVNAGFKYVVASSWRLEGKAKTPAGKAEQVRPRRSVSDEEAQRSPAESEVLHGNQQRCLKCPYELMYPIYLSLD